MDVGDDRRAIGRRLRRVRKLRRKSLEVLAGLSGLSTATLSRIENGLRALDSRSEIAALADALQVAPSELVGTGAELTPGSANKDKDDAVEVVHHALTAVELGHLDGGRVCSVDVLPAEVDMRRMKLALEAGEPDRAVSIGAGIRPQEISIVARKAGYWMDYGQALARTRGRYDDAVRALRTAERLFPERMRRNPFVRDALAELLPRSRRDAVGMELRGMAYRAGLPV